MKGCYANLFKLFLLVLIPGLSGVSLQAQDTTVVQTFTFSDITKRRGTYVFPDDTHKWRKILMYYTLKCDPATTADNFACGEWDYLTYNYIYDHTGQFDSVEVNHPQFLLGGEDIASAQHSTNPIYHYYQSWQIFRVIDSVIAETNHLIGTGTQPSDIILGAAQAQRKVQFLVPASELNAAGLTPGNIDRMRWDITSLGDSLKHLTVRIKITALNQLDEFDNDNFTTVYSRNTAFATAGMNTLDFSTPYNWNGISNMIIEVSYTNTTAGTNTMVNSEITADSNTVVSTGVDSYVDFDNGKYLDIPMNDYDLGDEITISFWSYGDANALPANTSILEGFDKFNNRVINIHHPWSNSQIYWDAGEGSGYDRINKSASSSDFSGSWTHWAFTKNTPNGTMRIYRNGNLWHSGTNKSRTIGEIRHLRVAKNRSNGNPWTGKMDELRVWDKALTQTEIQDWMHKDVTSAHPQHSDLLVYFRFNSATPVNEGNLSLTPYWQGAPAIRNYSGTDRFRNGVRTDVRPQITLVKGSYQSHLDTILVIDTVQAAPYSVIEYGVSGNSAVATNISYPWAEGYGYTFDPNGNKIDSTFYAGSNTTTNNTLTYFDEPFEIVDRYEIGRFITPYGIGLTLGPDGFTWMYDVTEYASFLKDTVDLSAGNNQELIDLKFVMIEGTPPADVVKVDRIWGQSKSVRYELLDNDSELPNVTMNLDPSASVFHVKTRLTGHGHNSNTGNYPHCCEWRDNTHYLDINGSEAAQWHIWQTHDCALNPVYPQGGTWPGAREGWCPGDVVKEHTFDITPQVTGNTVDIDYRITPVPGSNQGMGNGNYVVGMHLLQYGAPHHANDAEIYDVVRPNDWEYYSRTNPVCQSPSVVIRNNGSSDLTSLKITYQVSGGDPVVYNWSGNLGFLEKEQIDLPIDDGSFYLGDTMNFFTVTVSEPNGVADEYSDNDSYTTEFQLPDIYPTLVVNFRTNEYPQENSYTITDAAGVVVHNRDGNNLTPNTTYRDTLYLSGGCYTLELTDANDDGLSYWANTAQGSGYLQLWNHDGQIMRLFESEFGNKITHAFAIGTLVNVPDVPEDFSHFQLYPNPSQGEFVLELAGYQGPVNVQMMNMSGQTIFQEKINVQGSITRNYQKSLPAGLYLVRLEHEGKAKVKKLIIE